MVHRGASFREAGAGVPVVCIHASASSSGQWRPLMERLAGRFRSLAVSASSRGVARLLAKTLPSVTTVEIDGVGHMAPVTHPDRVNTVIASYLERVTATG